MSFEQHRLFSKAKKRGRVDARCVSKVHSEKATFVRLSRIAQLFAKRRSVQPQADVAFEISTTDLIWSLGSISALHQRPFDASLLIRELAAPPLTTDALITAARALTFRIRREAVPARELAHCATPCLVVLRQISEGAGNEAEQGRSPARLGLVAQATDGHIVLFRAGTNQSVHLTIPEFEQEYLGSVFQLTPETEGVRDPDGMIRSAKPFGFSWFIPELLKHRRVWRDVLTASLFIQVLALATPVFTQIVIDKVVVHRTQSTLVVIALGMIIFAVFSAVLSWVRQYLVLHTGNRVDAVLGAAVFEHILKLPTRYFETRPTGVITARLRGVENIREFIASTAVTLVLDLPFLLIFVAIMLFYSVPLTLLALAIIGMIVVLSIIVAPLFRTRLNEQFLLGARNQAFATEYIAGLETVKSLQMEPQVRSHYNDNLAEYLRSGFGVRQIANTYNVFANGLEQIMGLLILVAGATYVMQGGAFTIGMLVAFQMFANRVSQPLLRLVGLWQQFQQARLSVIRLGDIMNAAPEPYSLVPGRAHGARGLIEIDDLGFRYGPQLPLLFKGLDLRIEPGRITALMGPSGCGKSTLAKLLQGMYRPSEGRILIDGQDISYLPANELRANFGVVPQETILFSGTIYSNLIAADARATFEQVTRACRVAEIHDTIERLPNGYQTEIGERGVGLSGGQKQRVAIARALIKSPKVLIFDEATSSLDAPTAEHFCTTINQLKGKVTMLFITHALPRNLQVDEIVQMGAARLAVPTAPLEVAAKPL
jgi:subfamily B ATP-binding cassette protein HlyB/CyaB